MPFKSERLTEPQVGDRVRIVAEGVVKRVVGDFGLLLHNDANEWLVESYIDREGVTVEVLEPPVETFKPGDVVRSKAIPEYRYYLAEGGYLDMTNNYWTQQGPEYLHKHFTSKHYERVNLQEAPF